MIAALYSSRDNGTKHFKRKGVYLGWDTIVRVYNGDLFRAKQGVSRRVPGLKYSHIVRDSWTRLNVLPAKIMQVNCSTFPSFLRHVKLIIMLLYHIICIQQPYMLAAIKEMAKYKDEVTRSSHLETAEYLEACNKLFENGILSHDMIKSMSSPALENMRQGFAFFEQWHLDLSQSDTGKY